MSGIHVANIHLNDDTYIYYSGNDSIEIVANNVGATGSIHINNGKMLAANQTANIAVGFTTSSSNNGVINSGSFTPNVQHRTFQHYYNGGAHTLLPPTDTCTLVLDVINTAEAGVVNLSSFTSVSGELTTETDAEFRLYIQRARSSSFVTIVPLGAQPSSEQPSSEQQILIVGTDVHYDDNEGITTEWWGYWPAHPLGSLTPTTTESGHEVLWFYRYWDDYTGNHQVTLALSGDVSAGTLRLYLGENNIALSSMTGGYNSLNDRTIFVINGWDLDPWLFFEDGEYEFRIAAS